MSNTPARGSRDIARTPQVLRIHPASDANQMYLKLFFLENQRMRLQVELESLERRRAQVVQSLADVSRQAAVLRDAAAGPEATAASGAADPVHPEAADAASRIFRVSY